MSATPSSRHTDHKPLREFGERLDAIQQRVRASLGQADRRYITRLIRLQRSSALIGRLVILASLLFLPQWGHALASWAIFWPVLAAGTLALTLGMI